MQKVADMFLNHIPGLLSYPGCFTNRILPGHFCFAGSTSSIWRRCRGLGAGILCAMRHCPQSPIV
jgi:hypothetical protein